MILAMLDLPRPTAGEKALPEIPLFDVTGDGPLALLEKAPERLATLIAESRRHYGGLLLRFGDRATRQWLTRNDNPYRAEIAEVARRVAFPGAYLLNLSYEWSCTAGVGPDPLGSGSRMLRTLDWPLSGLGRNAVISRQEGEAGPYHNVTWPGFVAVTTAMADGRFSAAINQPPRRRLSRSCYFDWAIARTGVWRQSGLPPSHLLRRVFDHCRTYAEAKRMLIDTPLCLPAFFTLSGVEPGEGCVIERLEHEARVHEAPTSISNHFLAFGVPAHDRSLYSAERRAAMEAILDEVPGGFAWVAPPVLNAKTRLSVVANAARGELDVLGWEEERPVTQVFMLAERRAGGTARTRPARGAAARA